MPETQKLIMLIDDDNVNNFINRKKLNKFNPQFEVIEFVMAENALLYLKDSSNKLPDVVFLDINMPSMNGWEFLDEYKNLNLDLLIIMLTSSIAPSDQEKAQSYKEVSDFWRKPLNKENLAKIFPTVAV